MIMLKDNCLLGRGRKEYLADFKAVRENGWWKISKFPALLGLLTLIYAYSPPDAVYGRTLAAFLFYAWFDISLHMSLIEKKINILYLIESDRDVEDVNSV